MKTLEHTTVLEPRRFTASIKEEPEFLASLPKESFSEIAPENRREHLQRAIATGAFAIADRLEQDHGEYNLDANLYRLVGTLSTFHESSQTLDRLREQYDTPRHMPPEEKQVLFDSKRQVTEFNHILREVINAGASKFGFDDLLTFMTNMRAASGERDNMEEFYTQAREALIGVRNEMAFEQVLIAGGIDYKLGSLDEDALGGDFIIEGIPIDVKSNLKSTERAKEKARRMGRDPNRIIWSHTTMRDYQGKLTLPYELNSKLLAEIKPELDKALHP